MTRYAIFGFIALLLFLVAPIAAQVPDSLEQASYVTLERGTLVTLKTEQDIHSDEVEEGSIVPLIVGLDVVKDGQRLALTGMYAEAKVMRVSKARKFGKGGLLEIEADNIQLIDGQRIRVAGDRLSITGKNRKFLAWTLAIASPGIGAIFAASAGNSDAIPFMIPFAGMGFFVKGKEAKIPAGTLLSAQVLRSTKVRIEQ